jgi:hypothetical protein
MSLTNILLFLILVTLATYLFTPWKNMQKPPTFTIMLQWLMWLVIFSVVVFLIVSLGIK